MVFHSKEIGRSIARCLAISFFEEKGVWPSRAIRFFE